MRGRLHPRCEQSPESCFGSGFVGAGTIRAACAGSRKYSMPECDASALQTITRSALHWVHTAGAWA